MSDLFSACSHTVKLYCSFVTKELLLNNPKYAFWEGYIVSVLLLVNHAAEVFLIFFMSIKTHLTGSVGVQASSWCFLMINLFRFLWSWRAQLRFPSWMKHLGRCVFVSFDCDSLAFQVSNESVVESRCIQQVS